MGSPSKLLDIEPPLKSVRIVLALMAGKRRVFSLVLRMVKTLLLFTKVFGLIYTISIG